ncbi:class II aaRS and biotin synthetase [Ascodesmis nigricans]|uniref:Class II aaRS and biotin synthetase n=1 Tax=Ascodesmis nigricans TaxID=341454 RepID=A0A4S2N368_9PEZI|nr:class II aaRS and biotin synthetase [Ascodesmis nigricans]
MATTKAINVLIYSGAGTTTDSVRHCVSTLRHLLSPHFAVSTVSANALLKDPWLNSCALLVFPGGADLPYCNAFNGAGNRRISQYVRQGGSYLGFCAGGYYGSGRCEFEEDNIKMAVVGSRELKFFPGTCRGAAFRGFEYGSERGARPSELLVKDGEKETRWRCYFNGGGVFVDAAKMKNEGVEVLAEYTEDIAVDGGEGKAAVVYRKFGNGHVVLTGPHPEFAAANLDKRNGGPEYEKLINTLAADDAHRIQFIKLILSKLDITVPEAPSAQVIPELSSIHLTSFIPSDCGHLLSRLSDIITDTNDSTPEKQIKDEADTFIVEVNSSSSKSSSDAISHIAPTDTTLNYSGEPVLNTDYTSTPKRLIIHNSGFPNDTETPHFNHAAFYGSLEYYRSLSRMSPSQFGQFMLYGETVTSTNTLLEKNVKLLTRLPSGTTFTATTQIAGRGRGSNVWVSPQGCLIFSTVLEHPLFINTHSPIVFVQYIVAMAIVKAIKNYDPASGSRGYKDIDVKLKWPNDIYAKDPKTGEYTKIVGILVQSTFLSNSFHLVVGCGINTSNPHPSTSLNTILSQLHPALPPFSLPRLLAAILVTFEEMYLRFCRPSSGLESSFVSSGLRDEYHEMWLHSGQEVTLEMEGNERGKVVGLDGEWGLLEIDMLEGREKGRRVRVQPDGNGFDFFTGLVRKK